MQNIIASPMHDFDLRESFSHKNKALETHLISLQISTKMRVS
jgi:hypothetical protein